MASTLATCRATKIELDDEYVAPTTIGYYLDYPGDYTAQTFTVGHTGQLAAFGIQFSPCERTDPLPSDDLLLRIIRTDAAGVPDITQVLGSVTIDRSLPFTSPPSGF